MLSIKKLIKTLNRPFCPHFFVKTNERHLALIFYEDVWVCEGCNKKVTTFGDTNPNDTVRRAGWLDE